MKVDKMLGIALVAVATMSGCKCLAPDSCCKCAQEDAVLGRWALDLKPLGDSYKTMNAGWLGVTKKEGRLTGSMLWRWATPFTIHDVSLDDAGRLHFTAHGAKCVATVNGDAMSIERTVLNNDGTVNQGESGVFPGRRIPLVTTPEDLEYWEPKYGQPVDLFANGLDDWKTIGGKSDKDYGGWTFKDGVLVNRVEGRKDVGHLNLITKRNDFKDFKLSFDVNLFPGCNSGVYLRGIYEIQMLDTIGKPNSSHNMCALYGRVAPSQRAEKKAGEWQKVEIVLARRLVTVTLNGVVVLDHAPCDGVTGGALTADEFVPGPLYLQGDHSDVQYRNMVLTPIVN